MSISGFSVDDWWAAISAVGVLNIVLLGLTVRHFNSRKRRGEETFFALRGWQVALSAGYVFVCAFRSWLPRADVQRICLHDSWLSCVILGRSAATLAELCFVAQWALILYELSRGPAIAWVARLARLIVPIIVVAEICSWYAVLTTNYLGNACEQSLWTLTVLLVMLGVLTVGPHYGKNIRRMLSGAVVACVLYILFMTLVDVPMYVSRWQADEAAGKTYLTLAQGLRDAATRWIVTHSWDDWREEVVWMSLYFGPTVWFSIGLIRAPRFEKAYHRERQRLETPPPA